MADTAAATAGPAGDERARSMAPLAADPVSPDPPQAEPAQADAADAAAAEGDELFRRGVALFNGVRYWHAHEAWEELWRVAPPEERDFYQGLIQVAAGLLHLQRRNARGARNKLREGLARLRPYLPTHRGIFVNELIGKAERILDDLDAGRLPYLIPPVIRYVDLAEEDLDR